MPPDAPAFHRPLALGRVGPEGRTEMLEAGEAERAALARRLHIPAVEALRVVFRLSPEPDGAVRAEGRLEARVVQECVVTLDPVPQEVAESFALRLLPAGREPADGPDDLDEIETEGNVADLGEVAAEQLALALDPYPRASGAELPAEARDSGEGSFAALAALKGKA